MIKFIRYWIRNVLGFSKTEANGLPILILIVIVFFFAPQLYKWYSYSTYTAAAADKLILDSLTTPFASSAAPVENVVVHQFSFDPNLISLDSLLLLGLKRDVAQRIINYRNAGGSFRVKKDLKKIYGLSAEKYDQLASQITLPEKKIIAEKKESWATVYPEEVTEYSIPTEKPIAIFDINQADTSQLKSIYGIGPVLSGRIVKYRNLLGGFVNKEQLKEVYGIKEEVYGTLAAKSFIDENYVPEQRNINQDSVKQLASHPYISYNVANAIYNYRQQHGPFEAKSDLLRIHLFDSVLYRNIVPYIDL